MSTRRSPISDLLTHGVPLAACGVFEQALWIHHWFVVGIRTIISWNRVKFIPRASQFFFRFFNPA